MVVCLRSNSCCSRAVAVNNNQSIICRMLWGHCAITINHFILLDVGVIFCYNRYMNCWVMAKNVWIKDLLSHWILVCWRQGTRSKTTKPRTSRWDLTIQTDLICKRKNVSWTTVWFITWGCKSNSTAENEKLHMQNTLDQGWSQKPGQTRLCLHVEQIKVDRIKQLIIITAHPIDQSPFN